MTNESPFIKGMPTLSEHFSLTQQGEVSKAFDHIIMHCTDIAMDARVAMDPDMPLSHQDIEEIETNAHDVHFAVLQSLVDHLTMYVPDIPHSAIIATLYMHTDFVPPDLGDEFETDDQTDFIKAEHGQDTADYFDALMDLEFKNPKKDNFPEDKFRLAAKAAIVSAIYTDLDAPDDTDFPTVLKQTRLDAIELLYNRLIYLHSMAGDLDDPLEKFFQDHRDTMEDAIDAHTAKAINLANIAMKSGPKLF